MCSSDLFPRQTYNFKNVLIANDPLDKPMGAVNIKTGQVLGTLVFRNFFVQSLLLAVLDVNNGRIAPGSFYYLGPALFERGARGESIFRFDGNAYLPFAGFTWPDPTFDRAKSFLAGPGSELNPVFRVQAMTPLTGTQLKSGGGSNILSQIGERFSFSFRLACDGSGNSSFEYTNTAANDHGGTFKMDSLGAVTCLNQRGTSPAAGTFNSIVFSGLGSWSKDEDRHLASVQVNDDGFVSILVDGGQLSNANSPLASEPLP